MYDIITVGSASVDILVKARSETLKHEQHVDVCYHLGDKLLIEDLIFTTGGGGTNTAVAFSRLGLKTGFLGVVGEDFHGEMILKELDKEGVDFLGRKKKEKTGYSIVLTGHQDRTILVYKGVNNNFLLQDSDLSQLKTKWLSITTMLGKSFKTLMTIAEFGKEKGMKISFNPSLYLAEQGLGKLNKFLRYIDILILNKEEAFALSQMLNIEQAIKEISKYVHGIIVVTDGARPVYAYDGNKIYMMKIKKIKPVDTTGVGDAFASGFVYGIMRRKDIDTSLRYGLKESSSVLKHIGAKNNLLRSL